MNVLVLGGNGFIGSHIVDELLKCGHNVRVLDRSPERFRPECQEVDYRLGSWNDDSHLAAALENIDAVYHLISTTVPSTSNLDPVNDIQSNLVNTIRLLDQMREKKVSRIIYLSSGGTVYGDLKGSPISEQCNLSPICSYAVVKVAIENYLYMYQKLYGITSLVIRASNPYGPRQGNTGVQGLIGTCLNKVLNSKAIEVWGDGSVIRDYIFIGDLARLCVSTLEKDITGIFNAGSGVGYSVNDVIQILFKALGEKVEINYKVSRAYDVKEVVLDISKVKKMVGWEPEVGLEDGIKRHYNWLVNKGRGNEY